MHRPHSRYGRLGRTWSGATAGTSRAPPTLQDKHRGKGYEIGRFDQHVRGGGDKRKGRVQLALINVSKSLFSTRKLPRRPVYDT